MNPVPTSRYVAFLLIAVLGCALDLWTKHWMFADLGMPGQKAPWVIVPGYLNFATSLNEGALFGIGQGKVALFAGLSVVAAIGVVYWLFVAGAATDRLLTIALSCIMAGIFGNLYDRLGMHGLEWSAGYLDHAPGDPVFAVRDWIHFFILDAQGNMVFNWPVFNIADTLLVCGAILLVIHAIFTPAPDKAPVAASQSPAKAT
jgi:signal peptidase II